MPNVATFRRTQTTSTLDREFYPPGTVIPADQAIRDIENRVIRREDAVIVNGNQVFHRLDDAVRSCDVCNTAALASDLRPLFRVGAGTAPAQTCHSCRVDAWSCGECSAQVASSVHASYLTNGRIRTDTYETVSRDYTPMCPRCAERERLRHSDDLYGRILSYSDRRVGNIPSEDNTSMLYGLEVECCAVGGPRAEDVVSALHNLTGGGYYVTKHDGSLDNGFEIVTRPDSMATHRAEWSKIFAAIGGSDYLQRHLRSWDVPRQCCGIHCHIDKSQLSALELGKLLVWLNHPDNREFIIKVAGRQPNSYTSFSSNLKVVDGRRLKNGRSEARYMALNVQANTAEFRIFRGTLNPEAFGKNLDFVEASVEWTSLGSGCSLQDIRVPAFIAFVKERRNRFPELWKHIVRWGYAPADKKQAR